MLFCLFSQSSPESKLFSVVLIFKKYLNPKHVDRNRHLKQTVLFLKEHCKRMLFDVISSQNFGQFFFRQMIKLHVSPK